MQNPITVYVKSRFFSSNFESYFDLVFFSELAPSQVEPPTAPINKGNLKKGVSDSAKNNNNNETRNQVRPLFVQIADSFATPFVPQCQCKKRLILDKKSFGNKNYCLGSIDGLKSPCEKDLKQDILIFEKKLSSDEF